MKNQYKYILIIVLLLLFNNQKGHTQDAHYWSEQYGTRSTLLNGVVIGTVEDLGATFYNPGRLGLITNPSFLISAKAYEINTISADDGAGEGKSLSNASFGSAPSLLAGSFKVKKWRNHHFSYSFLTRQRLDFNFTIRANEMLEIIEASPGEEQFSGEVKLRQSLKEEWLGLTWAHKLYPNFSIGITNYVTIRNQNTSQRILLQALTQSNDVVTATRLNDFNFNAYGVLWKAGMAFDFSPFHVGLTITTPRFQLGGTGQRLFDDTVAGGAVDGDGGIEDFLVGDIQYGIGAKYKSSWALGLGLGYTFNKSFKIHTSMEWYDAVAAFRVLETNAFEGETTGEIVNPEVVQSLDQVLNYGAGLEWIINDNVVTYASFTTDFSSAKKELSEVNTNNGELTSTVATWDLTHIGGGVSFQIKKVNMVLGLTNSYGKQHLLRPINLPNKNTENEDIFDSDETTEVQFNRWKIVFGFSFGI